MKRMERAIGGRLFIRSSPIQLTELGSKLKPAFVQIIEAVNNAQCIIQRTTVIRRARPEAATAISSQDGDAIS